MKKNLRKLNLSRETLRILEIPTLGVVGAANTRQCPSYPDQGCTGNTCDCTLGCTMEVCTTR